jgi:hypothetical protein
MRSILIAENENRLEAVVSILLRANICIKSSKIDKQGKAMEVVCCCSLSHSTNARNQNYH